MTDLGLKIISDILEETKFDQTKSNFFSKTSQKNQAMVPAEIKNDRKNSLYHLPATVLFHHPNIDNERRIKIPVDELFAN